MKTLKFHRLLYPPETLLTCMQEYAPYFRGEQKEDGDYFIISYADEQKQIALEFVNYLLAAVRAHANH